MATKLRWSGARIATLVGGRARLHDAGGATVADLPFGDRVLDLGFDADDRLVAIERGGRIATYAADGALAHQAWLTSEGPQETAVIAPRGRLAAYGTNVYDFGDHLLWRYRPDDWDIHTHSPVHLALLPLGGSLALAHATLPGDKRPPGRDGLVLPIEPMVEPPARKDPRLPAPPRRPIVDRHWLQTRAEPGPTLFAFDAEGHRMIHASPESTPHVGAIRIGKDRAYTETHPGGAHAIALDPRGIIAAYAYPAAPRRFRIDYLDPDDSERSMIAVLESLSIEPSLPDIAALAFSPDSHAIACVATSGAIEIVPVP